MAPAPVNSFSTPLSPLSFYHMLPLDVCSFPTPSKCRWMACCVLCRNEGIFLVRSLPQWLWWSFPPWRWWCWPESCWSLSIVLLFVAELYSHSSRFTIGPILRTWSPPCPWMPLQSVGFARCWWPSWFGGLPWTPWCHVHLFQTCCWRIRIVG